MVMREVVIRDVPAMNVVSLDHVGSYMQIGKAFDSLFGWLAQQESVVGRVPDDRHLL